MIATQCPLESTSQDFWEMILENKTTIIITLCNLIENGKVKCHQYWPDKLKQFDNFSIILIKESLVMKNLVERIFSVTNGNQNHIVTQLHFQGWPDHSVPLIDEMMIHYDYMFPKVKTGNNVVIHCSAGIGRTGTFISSFLIWDSIFYPKESKSKSTTLKVSVFNTVLKVKESRCFSVENETQYTFIYKFTIKILEEISKKFN